jgi:hypothetical protein
MDGKSEKERKKEEINRLRTKSKIGQHYSNAAICEKVPLFFGHVYSCERGGEL